MAFNARLPLMQQLLYGCCLENATVDSADKALAALESDYYDWNEVRVSTATELSESMHMLPESLDTGNRVRQILQSIFETHYAFDLEKLKKENIGAAVKKLHKLKGTTPFSVAYVTQITLSGHSIPVGSGALEALYIVGALTDKEKKNYTVPGLERAISKNRGIEFGSLLNQLGAELVRAPHGPTLRKILLAIAPDAKDRLPKRKSLKQEEEAKKASAEKAAAAKKKAIKKGTAAKVAKASKTASQTKAPSRPKGVKKTTAASRKKGGSAKKKSPPVKAKKKPLKKKAVPKKVAKKKKANKKASKKVAKKSAKKKTAPKTASSRIGRRKPR